MTTQAPAHRLFPDDAIAVFDGEYRWLSNFHVGDPIALSEVWWPPSKWRTTEHAFQAAKVDVSQPHGPEHFMEIAQADTPGNAKRLGSGKVFYERDVALRPDWEQVKVPVMLACLRAKFEPQADLARKLIDTSPRVLIEGNTWGDTFWGVTSDGGKNMLGRLLMLVRAELLVSRASGVPVKALR